MDVSSVENLLGTPVSYADGEGGALALLSGHETYDWHTVTWKSVSRTVEGPTGNPRDPAMSKSETATCRVLAAHKARYSGRDAPPAVIL
jgi:hypothetical protein